MSIQPVRKTRVYENIVHQLAAMVTNGELRPGDRLPPERELAKAFGVGRPTLRQALTVLAEAGVVEIAPGSGVYLRQAVPKRIGSTGQAMGMVLMTEKKNLYDLLELRVAIEGEAAYLAALRRGPEHVERLQQAYRALETAFLHGGGKAIHEDYQFHCTIAESARNPAFLKVMASLADLFLQGFRETTRALYDEPDRVAANLREHRVIVDAIAEQRPEEARAAMLHHLQRVARRLRQAEEAQPGAPAPPVREV